MVSRFGRIGIQKRIMLYVAVGVTIMFGSAAFVGLNAIQQATELVYQERLSTAYTTAGVLEGDIGNVALDIQERSGELLAAPGPLLTATTQKLVDHLSQTDRFPFFQVTGAWTLDSEGRLLAEAGRPQLLVNDASASIVSAAANLAEGKIAVVPAVWEASGGTPFAIFVTRIVGPADSADRVVAVHAVSVNSSSAYVPTYYLQARAEGVTPSLRLPNWPKSDLEVVNPYGITVLGIGEDERPGERSIHFPVIQGIMAQGKPVSLLHKPSAAEAFEPHVMAVVPLGSSGFYVALEQRADVALALPIQLQQELVVLTSLGFLVTLLVAWVTTRQVVKPTEQLTAAARRMAQGDLESPIEVNALDEVGQLAEDIETMRRQLKSARDDLEQAKLDLEHKVAERTRRLHETLGKVIAAQEEERLRLARELHDETSQGLGALCVSLDRLGKVPGQLSPQGLAEIEQARAMARSLLQETRRLIYDLRPSVLDDMGLEAAIRWSAETHLQRNGVEVTICNGLDPGRLAPSMEVALFRVAQEAIVNIERHAQARHASIVLERRGSSVGMQVWDDGKGFDSSLIGNGTEASGAGLEGMQERAHLLGGSMEIVSAVGKGTIIKVEVPLE